MNLHLIDTSILVNAGKVNKTANIVGPIVKLQDGFHKELTIPSGGIAFNFNVLWNFAHSDRVVFIMDRYATIKKRMYSHYKEGRFYDPSVSQQKNLIEIIFENAGIEFLYREDYEADDLIYTLCKKYKHEYDMIYVHTNDMDLAIVIDDNVNLYPATSKGKLVTKENYDRSVNKNRIVPYNSVTLDKIIFGDTSDNIPPMSKETKQKLFNLRVPIYEKYWADKEMLTVLIGMYAPEALPQLELVFPLEVPALNLEEYRKPDMDRITAWANIVGCRKFPKARFMPKDITKIVEDMFDVDL